MKLFIKCQSPLLQKTLDKYLKEFKENNINDCNFCVSDKKIKSRETFIIGYDIKHPFTKKELIKKIKIFDNSLKYKDIKYLLNNTIEELKKSQSQKINNLAKSLK